MIWDSVDVGSDALPVIGAKNYEILAVRKVRVCLDSELKVHLGIEFGVGNETLKEKSGQKLADRMPQPGLVSQSSRRHYV